MNIKKNIALFAGLGVLVAVTYFGLGTVGAENKAVAKESKKAKLDLTSEKAKLGYTYGAQMAEQFVRSGLAKEVELDAVFAAYRDIVAGNESQLSVEQMQQVQAGFQQKQQAAFEVIANENKTKGDAFMKKDAKNKETKTTESGLQYQVVRKGKGKKPTAENSVKVHYLGSLIDGTPFDSSYDRGEPATFPVSGVIPGFAEGLQLMKEGAKYRFVIPSEKAYGPQGPASIGPNQVLVFEVELIEVI